MSAKVIDWEYAESQTGGDLSFLEEVLNDLLQEAAQTEVELQNGIKARDFELVRNTAHRIKGSASYLACDALKNVSLDLQNLGKSGLSCASPSEENATWTEIRSRFVEYQNALVDLTNTVRARK